MATKGHGQVRSLTLDKAYYQVVMIAKVPQCLQGAKRGVAIAQAWLAACFGYLIYELVLNVGKESLYGSLGLESYSSIHAGILHLLQHFGHLCVWVLGIGCIFHNSFQVEGVHVGTS